MDIDYVESSLNKIFNEENHRIVFWYDGDKEFQEVLPSLGLAEIKVISMDETCPLELKIKLELEDKDDKYLIYDPNFEPKLDDDWLLDIKLYSYIFHADKASIILRELGLINESMRSYIKDRLKFFRNQERINKLKKIVSPNDMEEVIDLKMISVLAKSDVAEPYSILMNIFDEYVEDRTFTADEVSTILEEIGKYNLKESFWRIVSQSLGYVSDSPKNRRFNFKIIDY